LLSSFPQKNSQSKVFFFYLRWNLDIFYKRQVKQAKILETGEINFL